jgi:PAT family beta-lactamase induction signal transducer AmpG
MAINGKSLGEIGAFVGIITIPWSLKALLAPIIDRYTFLDLIGKDRGFFWVNSG